MLTGVLGEGRVFQSTKDYLKYLAHAEMAMEDDGDAEDVYWGYMEVDQ